MNACSAFQENNSGAGAKPVVSFIAGVTAPPGRRMGHAGAIISGGEGDAESKIDTMRACGFEIAETPADMGGAMGRAMGIAAGATA